MIQDIFPHRFENQYLPDQKLNEESFVFHFTGNDLLLKMNGDVIELPKVKDISFSQDKISPTFLFMFDETSCFLLSGDIAFKHPDLAYNEISFFRRISQQEIAWVSLAAYHLKNWYEQNRFCGKCGSKTKHKPEERALICPECVTVVYPKISPAVIVAIISDDKILLARNTNFPGSWFSLIAGYVDVGETLEDAVKREVMEEVGIEVQNIRYYNSQPWPLSGSMMIGFIAQANATQPIVIDEKEIAEAAWFTRDNLPAHPSVISIAGEIIGKFERGEL
ncbi:NAD(+) diphosphatase [Saccharicrinis sp. FJH54]|uniref:NAD(+) diphosphatase n=1 Tax=Saccharicrinis sp. FJH54 TaxID=3344665 RepID=UPI0035D42BA6